MKHMTDERLAEIEVDDGYPMTDLEIELLQALKADREVISTLAQLVDEMLESETGPFTEPDRNYGWNAARSFFSSEIQAIINGPFK
jgi:hypothetical protein